MLPSTHDAFLIPPPRLQVQGKEKERTRKLKLNTYQRVQEPLKTWLMFDENGNMSRLEKEKLVRTIPHVVHTPCPPGVTPLLTRYIPRCRHVITTIQQPYNSSASANQTLLFLRSYVYIITNTTFFFALYYIYITLSIV